MNFIYRKNYKFFLILDFNLVYNIKVYKYFIIINIYQNYQNLLNINQILDFLTIKIFIKKNYITLSLYFYIYNKIFY